MFRHVRSFEYENDTLALHECPMCKSLAYDLSSIEVPLVCASDLYSGEAARAARYALEAGVSSYHIAKCALAALPDHPTRSIQDMTFVDIGAGLGLASYLVKTIFGSRTVTIEPSFTGKISNEILGLDVHRCYFEDLPDELLEDLSGKPCCLHLNSVVEHLVDPYAVLKQMLARAKVETLAIIVPDGLGIDFEGSFLNALPYLAPKDHRHLPSKAGIEALMKRLGFAHVHCDRAEGLLTGIGSRTPIAFPNERMIKVTEQLFLENMRRHPNPMVSAGGASRLLPVAVCSGNAPLMSELRGRLSYEADCAKWLKAIDGRQWDDLPFHLSVTCYWLAYDAMAAGRLSGALALLDVVRAFGDLIVADYPQFAMTSLEFKWAAVILKAYILAQDDRLAEAEVTLQSIIASTSNPRTRARAGHVAQAEAELKTIRAKMDEAKRLEQSRFEDNRRSLEKVIASAPAKIFERDHQRA